MGCSAFSATTEGEICYPSNDTPCGVLGGHAYSIIDVFSIERKVRVRFDDDEDDEEGSGNTTTKTVRLIRLRNPWGKFLIKLFNDFR